MPVATDGVTPRARALAAAIRTIRERSGISGRKLSAQLGMSHGTVSHWETSRRIPTVEDVASFLGVLGVVGEERQRILDLARHAAEPNWLTVGMPGIPQQLAGAWECERAASAIVEWAPMIIPGLLQTPEYARATATASGLSEHEVESRVMVRNSRREVIERRSDPVLFEALIGEVALREVIGGTEVLAEQLRFLGSMAKRKNVTVRVMPLRVGWHPGFAGPFVLYDFPDAPPVVHFEHYSSGAFVPDADDVQAYRGAVEQLRDKAMSPAASARLIAEIAKEMETAT
ncbi:MAG TPA: helix-turn-helix transcriptional regulator [Actinophytocola sp.]|uniref:helix-turn-helix domain-containing protein n=1 Tax=Actinophytocola sp. TaxID=1872138 RepID=UPI002DBC7DF3|nr:helix-turn-helix transcriptional regulator [Actinophytocola sp.]HEU5473388.1 helix-turn-helix transcriptional regulator [Actinophytocola sp.]